MRAMWRYIHARTIVRLRARLSGPVPDHSASLRQFLQRTIENRGQFAILQVGAYDGVSNDAVHDLLRQYGHVRAVLLEPQPGPYAALEQMWRDTPRVLTMRCALADVTGERPLYVIADPYKHRHPFPDQVSSFYRERVEGAVSRYMWRPPSDVIRTLPVPTIDWPALTKRHGPFDFLAIDTEGYDAEILRQVDFSDHAPEIILYEHRLLTRPDRIGTERLLNRHRYTLRQVNTLDTVAIRGGSPGF